jgi:hypothetical protein
MGSLMIEHLPETVEFFLLESQRQGYPDRWIGPRWGKQELTSIKAPVIEEWLKDLRFDRLGGQKKAVRLARKGEGEREGHAASRAS